MTEPRSEAEMIEDIGAIVWKHYEAGGSRDCAPEIYELFKRWSSPEYKPNGKQPKSLLVGDQLYTPDVPCPCGEDCGPRQPRRYQIESDRWGYDNDGRAVRAPQPRAFIGDVRDWMECELRVQGFAGSDPSHVMHEGTVIGYQAAPTVVIQQDDGQMVHWAIGLCRPALTTEE